MEKVWVLLANRTEAKIFRLLKEDGLEPVKEFENPDGKLKTKAFRNRQGRNPRDPHKENDDLMHQFIQDVCRFVNERGHQAEFDGLVLVAGPRVRGELHNELDGFVKKRILAELDQNLPSFNYDEKALVEEIGRRLPSLGISWRDRRYGT